MGYTHYYYTKPTIDQKNWNKLIGGVIPLFMEDAKIQEEHDNAKPPVANRDEIRFNGIGEDGHETFLLQRKSEPSTYLGTNKNEICKSFNFCKTANKPYDTYVTAVLILAKLYLEDEIRLGSDGKISAWQEGIRLIRNKVGIHIEMLQNPKAEHPDEVETAIIRKKIKEMA